MFDFYDWVLPNQAQHLNMYKDTESLYNFARNLWNSLDSISIYFFVAACAIAFGCALYYYYGYNKLPGRKYRISHWVIWLGITFAATFIATFILGYALVSSPLKETTGFLLRLSLINGGYALPVYFLVSFVICNLPVRTNAYRFLKIGK